MSKPLSICLFNREDTGDGSFRAMFENVPQVTVTQEATTWEQVKNLSRFGSVDVVVVSLEGQDEEGLDFVRRIAEMSPSCGIIGISDSSHPTTIISAMRAGCNQFVCKPVDPEDLRNAIERIRATRLVSHRVSKRVCVIGSSGGAGATTVGCNLAMELAQIANRRTVLVDLNLQFGDIHCLFDCKPRYSVADVCAAGVDVDNVLMETALHELPCNVSILARPEKIDDAHDVVPDGVTNMFGVLAKMFPFAVADLPRVHGPITQAAANNADHVFIITQLGVPFIRNATRMYECLLAMGVEDDRIDIVLNRCKTKFERITPDDIEAHFRKPVFAVIPNDYWRVQSSLDYGQPIGADESANPVRVAIQDMARRIVGEASGDGAAAPKGFLDRFWKRQAKTTV